MYMHIFLLVVWLAGIGATMTTDGSETSTTFSSTNMSRVTQPSTPATSSSSAIQVTDGLTQPSISPQATTISSTEQSNVTGLLQGIFTELGNIFKTATNSTTSPPKTSLPFSATAMLKKLPGGVQGDLLQLLGGNINGMDVQSVTRLFSSLPSRLSSLLKGHLPYTNTNDTGNQCFEDMSTYMHALMSGEMWALKMLDASGKPGPSILDGDLHFLGNFEECLDVASDVTEAAGQVKGDTCVVNIAPPPQMMSLVPAGKSPFGAVPGIDWHLCVPDTCSGPDIQTALQKGFSKINITVNRVTCHKDIKAGPVGSNAGAVAAIVLFALLGLLVLLGSLLDMNIRARKRQPEKQPTTPKLDAPKLHEICTNLTSEGPVIPKTSVTNGKFIAINGNATSCEKKNDADLKSVGMNGNSVYVPNGRQLHLDCEEGKQTEKEKPRKSPFWQRLLLCFSAVSNGEKILSVKSNPGSLTCLNGIRVLSIGWVILGHTFLFLLGIAENPATASKLINTFPFQVIMNGTLSVDSFFVLSGLLVTYLFLRETEKAGGVKVKHMVMYYVHRYLRLTPAYAFMIFVHTCLVRYLADGPTWTGLTDRTWCEENWYLNILYVNNLIHESKQCFGWGWYLANDMQFYVVAPLALIPFALGRKRGVGFIMRIVGACVTLAFIIISIILTAYYMNEINGDLLHNSQDFFVKVYQKPWCRIGTFAIGMGLGYILHATKSKIRMSGFVQAVGWVVAFIVAVACTFSSFDENAPGRPQWNTGAKAAHEALYRPGWGLVLSWVILMCCTGKGGIVNWMLSWDWWQPLARLTYGAYLIHLIMIMMTMSLNRSMIYYTAAYMAYEACTWCKVRLETGPSRYERCKPMVLHFFGYACLSYIFAFILAILVEAPFLQLEKMLLSK